MVRHFQLSQTPNHTTHVHNLGFRPSSKSSVTCVCPVPIVVQTKINRHRLIRCTSNNREYTSTLAMRSSKNLKALKVGSPLLKLFAVGNGGPTGSGAVRKVLLQCLYVHHRHCISKAPLSRRIANGIMTLSASQSKNKEIAVATTNLTPETLSVQNGHRELPSSSFQVCHWIPAQQANIEL